MFVIREALRREQKCDVRFIVHGKNVTSAEYKGKKRIGYSKEIASFCETKVTFQALQ